MKAKHPIREDLLKALDMHDKGMTAFVTCILQSKCLSFLISFSAFRKVKKSDPFFLEWNQLHYAALQTEQTRSYVVLIQRAV